MVCFKESVRLLDLGERADYLGISIERARFLAACSHNDDGQGQSRHQCYRDETIPYSDLPLLQEAHRLGIGLKDTAEMFNWPVEKVASYGIPFREDSLIKKSSGTPYFTLFQPENEQTN